MTYRFIQAIQLSFVVMYHVILPTIKSAGIHPFTPFHFLVSVIEIRASSFFGVQYSTPTVYQNGKF